MHNWRYSLSWSPLQTSVALCQWWIIRGCWRCRTQKWELQNLKPGLLHREEFSLKKHGPVDQLQPAHDALQPAFPSSFLWCHLIPSFSKSREHSGSLGKWDSNINSYKNHEELNTFRGPAGGMASSSNTKLAEQSWLKWQLAHTKQKLPPNSLSANEKVTFVRSF